MKRLRRARMSPFSRDLVRETTLNSTDFVYPIFLQENSGQTPVENLPGIHRWGGSALIDHVGQAQELGLVSVALFPEVGAEKKTPDCVEAFNENNLVCQTVSQLRAQFPDLGVICDVALDPYNPSGHDGFLGTDGLVENDTTVEALVKQALVQARAGAQVLAPSDMMDGRIGAIRDALDAEGFQDVILLSYAAKYASCFYGPFRGAIGSQGVLKGDKKSYQMDPANRTEAIREIEQDLNEGADWIMVKPGLPYLDIISDCKATFGVPTFAYHVSGEYAMWALAAEAGAIDRRLGLLEIMNSFKRAGADGILTYAAFEAAKYLKG